MLEKLGPTAFLERNKWLVYKGQAANKTNYILNFLLNYQVKYFYSVKNNGHKIL